MHEVDFAVCQPPVGNRVLLTVDLVFLSLSLLSDNLLGETTFEWVQLLQKPLKWLDCSTRETHKGPGYTFCQQNVFSLCHLLKMLTWMKALLNAASTSCTENQAGNTNLPENTAARKLREKMLTAESTSNSLLKLCYLWYDFAGKKNLECASCNCMSMIHISKKSGLWAHVQVVIQNHNGFPVW